MNRRLVCTLSLLTALAIGAPATAQVAVGDSIFPFDPAGDTKLLFDHNNRPVDGTDPIVTIPWFWHPSVDDTGATYDHVAGLKFTLKYDPYEVAILGVKPGPDFSGFEQSVPGAPGFSGHLQHSTIFDFPESQPTGPDGLPDQGFRELRGTVWVPQELANQSGIVVWPSHAWQFLELQVQARHSSNVRLNSDIDLVVSDLRPIYHLTEGQSETLNSVWVPRHITDQDPNFPDIPISSRLWEHQNEIRGIRVPASQNYYPGPLPPEFSSNPEFFPKSGFHATAHLRTSDYVHAGDAAQGITVGGITLVPSQLYHVGDVPPGGTNTAPLPVPSHSFGYVILNASDFVVGAPVATSMMLFNHFGVGIDHVPEPASLSLLGVAAVAMLMRLNIRRRRRQLA